MEFSKQYLKDWLILKIPKEINYECNLELKKAIEKSTDEGELKIGLDLTEVTFIGSSTMGIFCFAQKHMETVKGIFCLIGPNEHITSALENMGITKIIRLAKDFSRL